MWAEKDEIRTEKLTIDIIKNDINYHIKDKISRLIFDLLMMLVVTLIWCGILWLANSSATGVYITLGILSMPLMVILIFYGVQIYRLVHGKKRFTVVTETLVGSKERAHNAYRRYSIHYLYFNGYKRYAIPFESYTWSDTFDMSEEGVYNSSVIGDKFYLVVVDKRILIAYNCKFFKLED